MKFWTFPFIIFFFFFFLFNANFLTESRFFFLLQVRFPPCATLATARLSLACRESSTSSRTKRLRLCFLLRGARFGNCRRPSCLVVDTASCVLLPARQFAPLRPAPPRSEAICPARGPWKNAATRAGRGSPSTQHAEGWWAIYVVLVLGS